jgi:aryl-alcohol dehydrogenase-like predicted oxidoreductase
MRNLTLGPDGPAVSIVGFGGMPLSIDGRPDEATGVDVIQKSLDGGVTFIDTANVYCLDDDDLGHNERLIRTALSGYGGNGDVVLVATKGGLTRPEGRWEQDARPASLRRACEQSLTALGTDCIDLYQLHAPDPAVPFADSVGALAELREEGKIRWVGLSNVSVDEIEEAGSIVPILTVQNRLSPFFREAIDEGVVAHCGEKGIGFLAYSPVGGGRLNRKLPQHPVASEIADRHGVSPHEVVLAWVLAQGPTMFIIPGARTVPHAESSIRAADLTLDASELQAIDDAEFDRS